MKIVVARSEIAKLRRRMRRAYPHERIEYIWGTITPAGTATIYIFDPVKHEAGKAWCQVDSEEHIASKEHAEHAGYTILGSVHSHPNVAEAAPSEGDYNDDSEYAEELVTGIVGVWTERRGDVARLRTKVRFYGPLIPVETILT